MPRQEKWAEHGMADHKPFAIESDGVRLAVRITPRAGRDRIDGVAIGADGQPSLHVRLTAAPVDGAANQALIAFLAASLKMRKSDVTIRSGATARNKILHLAGDPAGIVARLTPWLEGP
jgi:uncharacterized protein (TIGR00251 family)